MTSSPLPAASPAKNPATRRGRGSPFFSERSGRWRPAAFVTQSAGITTAPWQSAWTTSSCPTCMPKNIHRPAEVYHVDMRVAWTDTPPEYLEFLRRRREVAEDPFVTHRPHPVSDERWCSPRPRRRRSPGDRPDPAERRRSARTHSPRNRTSRVGRPQPRAAVPSTDRSGAGRPTMVVHRDEHGDRLNSEADRAAVGNDQLEAVANRRRVRPLEDLEIGKSKRMGCHTGTSRLGLAATGK